MSSVPDIIPHGLEQARYALTNIIGMTNAHLRPLTIKRGLKQRALGRLKQLEIIVRRLLVLMALALRLAPVRVRALSVHVPVPEGVEIVNFPAPRRFALSPNVLPEGDPDAPVLFPCTVRAAPGPVPAAPFLARIAALYRVLENPDAHARRLARSLERQKARGEPRPSVMPTASAYRLRPELGMVATVLPGLIRAALESWESSG